MNKKIMAFLLTLAMIITTVLGNGFVAKAGGDEEPGADLSSQKVTNTSVSVSFDDEGYYPASLQYAIQNFKINLTYELGTVENLTNWQPNWGNEPGYKAYGSESYQTYYMKFYDGNGEEVDLSSNRVPVGEFTFKIERASPEEVVYTDTIKIIDPSALKQNVTDGSVTFSSTNNQRYEEKWYPANAEYSGDFIISKSGDTSSQAVVFVGIWKYENGVAERVNEGVYWYNNNSFEHNFTDTANVYFVAGETSMSYAASTDITWGQKKTLASISIDPDESYKVWNQDYYNIPLTLTYTDESTEVCTEWKYSSSIQVYGDDVYKYVDGIEYKTKNNDVIYAALKIDDVFYNLSLNSFKPGDYKMIAYAASDRNINAEADFTVLDFNAETIDLSSGAEKTYTVEPGKEVYYICETGDEQKKIAFSNDTSNDAYVYFFRIDEESNNFWNSSGVFTVTKETDTNTLSANSKYLIIISTESGKVNGTVGLYVQGKTASATINTDKFDATELNAWSKLPVTINFTTEDGAEIGSKLISEWDTEYYYPGCGYYQTKYNEDILYQLYKGDEKVSVPMLTDEILEFIGGNTENMDPDEFQAILDENGIEWNKVEAGKYTVKVFRNSISDANLLGSKEIEVYYSGNSGDSDDKPECNKHEWSKWNTVKEPTCTEEGLKERTCGTCGKTEEDTINTIPHETAEAVKASFGTDGTTAGINCSMCGTCDIKVTKAVAEPELSSYKYTYNGSKKSPTVVVKDVDGNVLAKDKDYTYTYSSSKRTSCGEYYVTVKLKGNYTGSTKVYYSIVPKAPSSASASISEKYNTIKFSWKKSTGASGYSVYYKEADDSAFSFIKDTTSTSLKKTGLLEGTKYEFQVIPYYASKTSKYYADSYATASAYTLKKMDAPVVERASSTKVLVKWNDIDGQSGYQISKSTSATGTSSAALFSSTSAENREISVARERNYFYKIRAYKTVNGKKIYGPWSDTVSYELELDAPEYVNSELYGYDDVKVSWKKVSGATGYNVYYKKAQDELFTYMARTTGNYVKKSNLEKGCEYDFKVIPYYAASTKSSATKYLSDNSTETTESVLTLTKIEPPVMSTSEDGKVIVSWTNVNGADGVQISKSTSSSKTSYVTKTTEPGQTEYVVSATAGKKYYYKVRAYKDVNGTKIYTPWSKAIAYKR